MWPEFRLLQVDSKMWIMYLKIGVLLVLLDTNLKLYVVVNLFLFLETYVRLWNVLLKQVV